MIKKGQLIADRYLIMNILYDTEKKRIYEAYHLKLGIEVIMKKISLINNSNFASSEVSILKSIKHQYIPQIYDLVNIGEDSYIIMEYIKGKSLDEIMKFEVLHDNQIIKWTKQLLMALDYMHNQSIPILHCDIKPSNIIVDKHDDACLIDFNVSMILNGFANPKGFSKHFAAPEIINYFSNSCRKKVGEVDYSNSYEDETVLLSEDVKNYNDNIKHSYSYQLNSGSKNKIDKKLIDNRADIYSIGALIYYMYTGEFYTDKSNFDNLNNFSINKKIIEIMRKALYYFRDKRYTSVKIMIEELENIV